MNKQQKIFVGLLLALGAIFVVTFSSMSPHRQANPVNSSTPFATSPERHFLIKQTINYGDNKPNDVSSIEVVNGNTALDILSQSQTIQTKEYSFGKMVESINGVENGTNNKYWLYYVNGEGAKVGASDYKVQEGDTIEWKFIK